MAELPKPRTWILSSQVTFADIEDMANAEAAANGWAVKVEPVVVDGQDAALVVFSEKSAADGAAAAMPALSNATMTEPDAVEPAGSPPAVASPVAASPLASGALSAFEQRLATVTRGEYDTFRFQSENDPGLAARIKLYWNGIGLTFPGVGTAWSAVFVSWCVKRAGADATEFKFSPQHSVFVNWAIANAEAKRGLFRAFPIAECAPSVGDIIHNNRDGNSFDFAFASSHTSYASHSAIVVDTGHDASGRFATTIGGNESDSIRRKRVALNGDGLIVQRAQSPFICVIQTLK